MSDAAWTDVREDARTFVRQFPRVGHSLAYVPPVGAIAEELRGALSNDMAVLMAGVFADTAILHRLGAMPMDMTVAERTRASSVRGSGSTVEWLWRPAEVSTADEVGPAWNSLCAAAWPLFRPRVERLLPHVLTAEGGPEIDVNQSKSQVTRLIHWLAWSGMSPVVVARVGWPLRFEPRSESELVHGPTSPRTLEVKPPCPGGAPQHPGSLEQFPWVTVSGWYWSSIDAAGRALVAAVDFFCQDPEAVDPARVWKLLGGLTKTELMQALAERDCDISSTKFDDIRKAARVTSSPEGSAGQKRRFNLTEIRGMRTAVENGTFQKQTKLLTAFDAIIEALT